MRPPIVFELCAETLDACVAARDGGADRIELCRALEKGGLTPGRGLAERAIALSGLPVHVLVRPHADGFCYSSEDFNGIVEDIDAVQQSGASGVVVGVLLENGRVDQQRMRELVERADGMKVTFHRAFDETPDKDEALEDVIATGAHRLLTSGGAPDVLLGAEALARLVQRAGSRIEIAAGGGLRLANVKEVARISGARHFHGSLQTQEPGQNSVTNRVRAMMTLLHEATL